MQRISQSSVRVNGGTATVQRQYINFIEGSNIGLTATDDAANNEIDVRIEGLGSRASNVLLLSSPNDWSPVSNWATVDILRVSPSGGGRVITGFTAVAPGAGSFVKIILNASSGTSFTIANESASSAAANRVRCPRNRDYPIQGYEACFIYYNSFVSRWWVVNDVGRYQFRLDSGGPLAAQPKAQLITGDGMTLTLADDSANDETDITIAQNQAYVLARISLGV